MKYILVFLTFGYLVIGLYACKKKLPNKPIDADLKAAFSFKPGTYWIFKDAISGQIDSFYVRRTYTFNQTSGNPSYTFDEINIDITEMNLHPAGSDTALWRIGLIQNILNLSDYYLDNFVNFDDILYPFISGPQSSAVYAESINLISSFNIGNNNFNNVADIHFSIGLSDDFYLNSDIGFIKIILQQRGANRVWELQRWKIVK